MEELEIKELIKENIDDVFEIEKTFFGLKNKDGIVSSLTNNNHKYFVLFYQNNVIGFYERSIILDEAELFNIAVIEDFQGRGFSKFLMNHFIDDCKKNNVRTIFLEVNKINNKAISLYNKFGFIGYSERKKYYGDNDAILMRLAL